MNFELLKKAIETVDGWAELVAEAAEQWVEGEEH